MATFNNRNAASIISSLTNLELTEEMFRTDIEDSVGWVGNNCERIEREKRVVLMGPVTGTGTTGANGFIRDPDLDTPDMMNPTPQNIELTTTITGGAVGTTQLADDSVTSAKIANGTIVAGDIADNAITTTKILDSNVTEGKLGPASVTTDKIMNGAVTADKLLGQATTLDADRAVTTNHIRDNAITVDKIANGNVTADKLANNSVNTVELVNNAVTEDKIVNGAVTADKLADNAVRMEAVSHLTSISNMDTLSASIPFYSVHLNPSGTGTINVTVPVGMFEGQTINITATRGMTITWSGDDPQGIGLAGSARIASGIWRTGGWYFSETVV